MNVGGGGEIFCIHQFKNIYDANIYLHRVQFMQPCIRESQFEYGMKFYALAKAVL
jgi:hypothetical protein